MGICISKEEQQQQKHQQHETERTSVWWDIENCRPPADVNPFHISRNISSALNCKGPLSISAFGDIYQLPKDAQNALTSTGISLNHIPSGKKDASDKAILVNMAFWAHDNPPPANVMLISGDVDFSTILHQLRMRKFNVLLARPEGVQVSDSLSNAASTVWYWSRLARGEIKHLTIPRNAENSRTMSGEGFLVKTAIFKLREELMLPSERNIRSCILQEKQSNADLDLKNLLDRNVRTGHLEVATINSEGSKVYYYLPRGCKLWDCMDINPSRGFHPGVWEEFHNFLTAGSPEMVQSFVNSSSPYQAAVAVRKHGKFSALSLGEICSLMQQACVKSWIKTDPKNWSPVLITLKQVEMGTSSSGVKPDAKPPVNSKGVVISSDTSREELPLKLATGNGSRANGEVPSKLVEHCRVLLKDKALAGEYPLSNLKSDFIKKFGYALDHTSCGYPKLSSFVVTLDRRIELQCAAPGRPHKLVRWVEECS